jgi:hypothetical protein
VGQQEGLQRGTLDHTPEAVEVWIMELQLRYGGRPLAVALEQRRGAFAAKRSQRCRSAAGDFDHPSEPTATPGSGHSGNAAPAESGRESVAPRLRAVFRRNGNRKGTRLVQEHPQLVGFGVVGTGAKALGLRQNPDQASSDQGSEKEPAEWDAGIKEFRSARTGALESDHGFILAGNSLQSKQLKSRIINELVSRAGLFVGPLWLRTRRSK